jgi:hypothetical protein
MKHVTAGLIRVHYAMLIVVMFSMLCLARYDAFK